MTALRRLGWLALLPLPCGAQGNDPGAGALEAFSAAYRARYGALPFAARARRTLVHGDQRWTFSSLIDAGVFSLHQETILADADGSALRPLRYHYRQRGLAGRRDRFITFDREVGRIRRTGDKVREHPLTEPAWDPLGWQLALRRDLLADHPHPAQRYSYRVSDGGGYEDYRFDRIGRESVTVPAGTYEALHLARRYEPGDERATRLWLAPAQGYLLLRLEIIDEDGRRLTVALTDAHATAAGAAGS